MKPIIKVENLGKEYQIGLKAEPYSTVRESLVNAVRRPLNAFRGSRKNGNDRFWALKDVNFEVHPGEVVGIIGRNGAGKSTLLKVLSRITEPTTGRVELFGRVGSLLEVGTGFHPELTGRENIYLNGAILGMRREEISKKFDEIVDFAEIEEFLDTPVKRYSSGMYVRLAFAVAAHLEPEILIVDEVLAVGDADFQRKCLRKMQDISGGEGRTVLFVSHNLSAIRQLCPKSLLLVNGACDAYGLTNDALDRYQFHRSNGESARSTEQGLAAYINEWWLVDHGTDRMPKHTCHTREHAEFEIRVCVEKPLEKVEFGFILRNETEEIIYSANSRDYDGDFFKLAPGNHVFRLKVRLPLRAGSYVVDLAIADEGIIVDHFVSTVKLRILDDFSGVLAPKWQGILTEPFVFEYERII